MSRKKRPIGVDLFCGVGGMSLGFEQAGFDIIAAVDFDDINVETHKKNFPKCETVRGDLSTMTGAEIRKETKMGNRQIDLLFGGPPCQGFSLIGKRDSSDPRNKHLQSFARLVDELAPSYFVVENVAGLLLGNAEKQLRKFIRAVKRAGYSVVEPVKILDASQFGVPQRRKRVFILGYRKGLTAPAYPEPTHGDEFKKTPTVRDAIGDLPDVEKCDALFTHDTYEGPLGKPSPYARVLRGNPKKQPVLTGCLRTRHKEEIAKRFHATKPGTSEAVSRYYRLSSEGISVTIRAGTGPDKGSFMAPRPIHPEQDRCITVREGARLHSFPDWFCFHNTKWHGFRQIGNSVPPFLARAVGRAIHEACKPRV